MFRGLEEGRQIFLSDLAWATAGESAPRFAPCGMTKAGHVTLTICAQVSGKRKHRDTNSQLKCDDISQISATMLASSVRSSWENKR
jgi:hypothetical protein